MIELRWFEEKKGAFTDEYFPAALQFRTMANIQESGIQDIIWTDWQDIPTVKEE